MEGPPAEEPSFYAVLNVAPEASDDEIRRAYRQLATTYHPDKHTDPQMQQEASRMFTLVQEAYEVLSDPAKRDIYDVYGREGLRAGLEVGERVKTKDELRKEWEQFQKQQERQKMDAQVNYRGVYVFKVDATALVSPYARNLPRTPEITNIYMTSGVDVPIESKDWGILGAEQDVVHLGGLVNVRKNVGGGSFLAGYKRAYADYSTFELHAAAGLKTLLTASSGVQLSQHAHASLTATWQPQAGVGLQFVTTRQLSENVSGEFSWVVGPPEATGMSLGLSRRTEKSILSGRIEVGAVIGLVARAVRQLGEATTGRASLKLSTSGIDLEVGSNRRVSEVSTAGASISVGLQGVVLKLRYSRAGHLFEFPILLSPVPDPVVAAAAYTLTPLLLYIGKDWVAGPLGRLIEARRVRAARQHQAEEVREALAHAAAAVAVMAPVARRRVAKEVQQGGLVIALALYGAEEAVKQAAANKPWELRAAALAAAAEQQPEAAAAAAQLDTDAAAAQQQQQEERQQQGGQQQQGVPTGGGGGQRQQQQQGAGGEEEELPPAVADVTVAVQYLVEGGRVVFHRGYSKSGMMGFCDPAPTQSKLLLVYFLFKGQPYKATILNSEGAVLPARGALVTEPVEAALVQELARQQQLLAGQQLGSGSTGSTGSGGGSVAADWLGSGGAGASGS